MKIKTIIALLLLFGFIFACNKTDDKTENMQQQNESNTDLTSDQTNEKVETPLIIFVELGSVNCIPCKKMQPVMKAIEEKYGEQVKVIFYDVWKADQKKYAEEYGVRLIPTQIFLNKNGKEIFRHEGFFPESDIDKLLQKHGLQPKQES